MKQAAPVVERRSSPRATVAGGGKEQATFTGGGKEQPGARATPSPATRGNKGRFKRVRHDDACGSQSVS